MSKIASMIGAKIGDDYIDMKITMRGFPPGATKRAQEDYENFIRTVQDAIMGFVGIPIDKVDNSYTLTSHENPDELNLDEVRAAFQSMSGSKH